MTILRRISMALTNFLILNLFITLVSLPVLVAWGLPLSWLSPFGNIIFSPFLSIFLLLSTISFFCDIICLPHAIIDQLLEWITQGWQWVMRLAPQNSFIGFSLPAFWALLIISLITLFIMMLPSFSRAQKRLAALLVLFCCSVAVLKATQPQAANAKLQGTKKDTQLIVDGSRTMLIDHGAFSERANPASWAQYQLVSDLIKATGSMQVDHLVLPRPTIRVCEAAASLLQHANVKAMYYPAMKGVLTGSHRGVFRKLYAIAKERGVALNCVRSEKVVKLGEKKIALTPGKAVKYREIEFHILEVILSKE